MSSDTTCLVAGSSGPWPETNSMLPQRMPWASGEAVLRSVNPVVGAVAEVTICFGMMVPRGPIRTVRA